MPCGSNHPPKSGDWNIKFKATAINFLNALDRIPKLMEQYKTKNEKLEKDLPTLQEIVGGTWKKKEELKQLKSEMATLERKIQLTLTPPDQQGEQKNSLDENINKNIPKLSDCNKNINANGNDENKTIKGLRL